MKRIWFERVAPYIPRGHWLPLAAIIAVTVMVLTKFALDAWVRVELSKRPIAEQPIVAPEEVPVDDDSAPGREGRTVEGPDAALVAEQTAADAPAERMVPEWMVELLLEALDRSEKRADKRLARRDEQIDTLARQLADMRGQLTSQQQQIVDLHAAQLKDAWAAAARVRQAALSTPVRSNEIPIVDQNGTRSLPNTTNVFGNRRTPALPSNDPFASDNRSPVVSPRMVPKVKKSRPSYLNVSPKRSGVGNGIPAGSSGARIQNDKNRHRAAVSFTRRYNNRSATSRLLGELETGSR